MVRSPGPSLRCFYKNSDAFPCTEHGPRIYAGSIYSRGFPAVEFLVGLFSLCFCLVPRTQSKGNMCFLERRTPCPSTWIWAPTPGCPALLRRWRFSSPCPAGRRCPPSTPCAWWTLRPCRPTSTSETLSRYSRLSNSRRLQRVIAFTVDSNPTSSGTEIWTYKTSSAPLQPFRRLFGQTLCC